jgi:L-ascorbate metabolism protein UlaG (beta-lactamase superfamily)
MRPAHQLVTLLISFLGIACGGLEPAPVVARRPPDAPPVVLEPHSGLPEGELRVTRVGHASVLLDIGGELVLTDPWFSEKAAYHHGEPLGIALEQLPRLSAVVASHALYDHFDIETFARYPHKDVPMFVGPDMVEAAREHGFTRVRELRVWERATSGALTVTAAPAEHGVPEVSFVLEAHGFTVWFGGDTLLVPELRELPRRFPRIDVALCAVNGLHAMGSQVVMTAEEAAELVGVLGARVAVPTHYAFEGSWFTDTFILSREGTPERFVAAGRKVAPRTQIRVLPPGQTLALKRPAAGASPASVASTESAP